MVEGGNVSHIKWKTDTDVDKKCQKVCIEGMWQGY